MELRVLLDLGHRGQVLVRVILLGVVNEADDVLDHPGELGVCDGQELLLEPPLALGQGLHVGLLLGVGPRHALWLTVAYHGCA